eukprot:jgi/Mesvir1/3878/Mv19832-RA.1
MGSGSSTAIARRNPFEGQTSPRSASITRVLHAWPFRRNAVLSFEEACTPELFPGTSVQNCRCGQNVHSDRESPNVNLSGSHASPDAALVPAMIDLLDVLEARVAAGRSKLSLHALPFLVTCRETVASRRDDVRQCASALQALGAQLQISCMHEVTSGTYGHSSCAAEVELVYQLVLSIRQATPGAEMEVAESLLSLAHYYRARGRYNEASDYFQRLTAVISCHAGAGHPLLAAALSSLTETLALANKYREAENACKCAVAIAAATLGEQHHRTQGYRRSLEAVRLMKARYESGAMWSVGRDRWQAVVSAVLNPNVAPA